ncbi:MAG: phage major capsid protein [Clostridium sp.]|nr:phage major capsid protein [Clostridium sp.]
MFKNREDYLNQREALVNKAQKLHEEGKYEDSIAVSSEIENLDKAFDNFAKSQANLKALEDNKVPVNLGNLSNDGVEGTVIDKLNNKGEGQEEGKEPTAYVNAWAKDMLGMQMTNQEKSAFNLVNQFTHTTANTGVVIPETVMTGIWKEIEEQYPLWNDVFKTYIKGKVTLLKSDSSTDAKWYDEETKVEDGKETFAEATLNGCELARCVTISWKLKEMAIDEFIPFIQGQLSEKIGAALGYGVSHGRGTPGDSDDWKEEPMGIITVLNKSENTSQVIEYEGTEPTYKQMTGAMAKVKGSYKNGASIYANGTTIWNELANIVDATGKPYFVANPIGGGVGTILGKIVKEDDSMLDGEILIGNPNRGYHANINKQVLLDSEDHKKERETDYLAYGIVDGNVRTIKAFALLKKNSV